MTNPATPTPSGGGMPKWLIILLVVLLVIILGCCGGIGTCIYIGRRAAQKAGISLQKFAEEAQRQAEAARIQAQQNGVPGANTPVPPAGDAGNPAAPIAGNIGPAQRLPSNFPSDVTVQPGLTSTYSMSDVTKGSGSAILKGNVKADDAVAYYTKTLEQNGWTQTANQSINSLTQLQYTKDDRTLLVQISSDEGATGCTVMLVYGKK